MLTPTTIHFLFVMHVFVFCCVIQSCSFAEIFHYFQLFFLSNTRGQSHVQILSWPMSPTFQMFLLLFPLVLFACTWAQLVAGSAPAPEESSACTTAACIWARLRVEQGLNRNSATKQSSTIHLRRPAGTATAAGRLYYQEKMSTAQRGAGI
jgi:hypothetical protein